MQDSIAQALHGRRLCVLRQNHLLIVFAAVELFVSLLIVVEVEDYVTLATAEAALVPDLAAGLNSFHGVHRLTATDALLKLGGLERHAVVRRNASVRKCAVDVYVSSLSPHLHGGLRLAYCHWPIGRRPLPTCTRSLFRKVEDSPPPFLTVIQVRRQQVDSDVSKVIELCREGIGSVLQRSHGGGG